MAKAVQVVSDNAPAVSDESAALISMIERAARDPNVDIDKMERLFQMQQRAVAQRARASFLAALAKLQAELPAAERGGTGHNNKKYARYEDVITALRPVLAEHGFSITSRVSQANGIIKVTGVLGHKDGHTEETSIELAPDASGNKTAVHAVASAISYGKRYVALTLTGIATCDDDDGKAASAPVPVTEAQAIELRDWLEATGTEPEQFLAYFKAESVATFPAAKFDAAIAAFKKKAGKA